VPSITRPSAKPGRPASAEADILAAARRLLDRGSTFTEIGVQEICTEAGVARSTFYSNFRDKTDLLIRLAADVMSSTFDLTTAWKAHDGVEGLAAAFLQVVKLYRDQAAVRRAVAEVATYDATARELWNQEVNRFEDWTVASIRAEQEAGRTPADLDLKSAARVVVVGGERAISDHVATEEAGSDAAFAHELAMIWWYGVYRRPAPHAL
jgi:AcrR family transcriptional regulator